jgi:hemolysin activation/secretion protein
MAASDLRLKVSRKETMSNNRLLPSLPYALLVLSHGVFAQQPPSAGSQMQQIPPVPIPQKEVPRIEVGPRSVPGIPDVDKTKLMVTTINVTGATVYSNTDLLALTGFTTGRELSLTDLRGMAAKIADYYHRNGYFVAQAYLPAQDIKDGTVTIAVIEGRYGEVTLRNQSRVSDGLANGLLVGLNSGDLITADPLENRLLLLSDLPGVVVKSTLVPGTSAGASDLIVDLAPGPRVSGEVDADNAGDYYTGEYRVGATVNINNLIGQGDVLSFRAMTSGPGMTYGRASYQIQFGKATVGVAYAAMDYRLLHGTIRDVNGIETDVKDLHMHGTAEIASIYASYPLIRSRNTNLYALINYDDKTFQDSADSYPSDKDKKAEVLSLGLHGDNRDGLGGGGLNTYSLTGYSGNIDIRTPWALADDAAGPRTNGHFGKLAYQFSRLQRITDRVSLYAGIYGQVASKNLDISEKLGVGGMYGVRSFPVGEAYSDEGYIATLEARLLLPKFSERMPGQMHLIGFVDYGSGTINKNPWTTENNHRTLRGAGIGLNWEDYNNFVVNAYWARKIGNEVATSAPDKNGRFWIQLVKYF